MRDTGRLVVERLRQNRSGSATRFAGFQRGVPFGTRFYMMRQHRVNIGNVPHFATAKMSVLPVALNRINVEGNRTNSH